MAPAHKYFWKTIKDYFITISGSVPKLNLFQGCQGDAAKHTINKNGTGDSGEEGRKGELEM